MSASEPLRKRALDGFWETVPSLWGFVRSHIRATATQKFDITVEQFHVLRFVRRGMSMSELAGARNISRPAISQSVDMLVKKGLLNRTRSTSDRRFVELTLTHEGNALLDAVFTETRLWMSERLRALSTEELEAVITAMAALKKMLE